MEMVIWIFLVFVHAVLGVKHECPGGSFKCPDDDTCCQLLDKTYGCCPLKDAVCCDDHIHCCPQKTKCAAGMCIRNSNETVSSHLVKNKDIECPGGQFYCSMDSTCCKGVDPSTFDCCPLPNAICCKDGYHCCAQGTVCDLHKQMCVGDGFVSQMYGSKKTHVVHHPLSQFSPITAKAEQVSNVICPGSTFQCPDSYTCCQLPGGNWGCCPFPKATCCNDHVHCCPENMHCDAASQFCTQGLKNITSYHNKPAELINGKDVICPDQTHCQEDTTCCELMSHKYGCCQYPNATCCSDRQHCCPSGYDCDTLKKQCVLSQKWNLSFI